MLQRYQNKELANWAVRICMKRKEIAKSKKGKSVTDDS
jgi:hypothetical protein